MCICMPGLTLHEHFKIFLHFVFHQGHSRPHFLWFKAAFPVRWCSIPTWQTWQTCWDVSGKSQQQYAWDSPTCVMMAQYARSSPTSMMMAQYARDSPWWPLQLMFLHWLQRHRTQQRKQLILMILCTVYNVYMYIRDIYLWHVCFVHDVSACIQIRACVAFLLHTVGCRSSMSILVILLILVNWMEEGVIDDLWFLIFLIWLL